MFVDNKNNFVEVRFDPETTSIFCTFPNQEDTSDKQCSIVYVECQRQTISQSKQSNTTNVVVNSLQIPLVFDNSGQATYCYIVTAGNTTHTFRVEGKIVHGKWLPLVTTRIG